MSSNTPPVTSSATASTSEGSSDAAPRSCPSCRKRMSTMKYDRHTICLGCRKTKCEKDVRCKECKDWSSEEMDSYLKHRRIIEAKNKKREIHSMTPAQVRVDSKSLKVFESRIQNDMQTMFKQFADNIKSSINPSIADNPCQVPGISPSPGGAGGRSVPAIG